MSGLKLLLLFCCAPPPSVPSRLLIPQRDQMMWEPDGLLSLQLHTHTLLCVMYVYKDLELHNTTTLLIPLILRLLQSQR